VRVTDGTTSCVGGANGISYQATVSGGDNDNMWSLNNTYLGVTNTGGQTCILHLNTSGHAVQVINSGVRPSIVCTGAFSFSRTQDNVYYCRPKSTLTQIQTCTITSDTTADCATIPPVDVGAVGICPGLPQPFTSSCSPSCSSSITTVTGDDDKFIFSLSNAGVQNTATWAIVYSKTLGCTVANIATNNEWNYCNGGACNTANSPSGTLSGCTGGSTTNGLHDSLGSLDGQYMYNTMHNAQNWTGCPGTTSAGDYAVWKIGTTQKQLFAMGSTLQALDA
jgi:hypothetical protein